MASVLQPEGMSSEPIEGDGDFRVRAAGAEISYSGEEVGWQVTVYGDLADTEAWIEQVTRQVTAAAGEPCEWLEL